MDTITREATPAGPASRQLWRRACFGFNAVVAWGALALEAWITLMNIYPATGAKLGEIDYHQAEGVAGLLGRMLDLLWFFTNWSVLLVAVVATLLALGRGGNGLLMRSVRLSSLVMIAITALVYAVLLGPTATTVGLMGPSNALRHQVLPTVTLGVFLVVGPRRWFSWRVCAGSLAIPLVWVVYTLARGTTVGAWPYAFLDHDQHGWAYVLSYVAAILVVGVVIDLLLWALDRLVVRLTTS